MQRQSNPDFLRLQTHWYKRLKDEGFVEIEDVDSPLRLLKVWHSNHFQKTQTPESFERKRQYFAAAGAFSNTHAFETEFERCVWECHAEGLSLRKTADKLGSTVWQVRKVIQALAKSMKETFILEPA